MNTLTLKFSRHTAIAIFLGLSLLLAATAQGLAGETPKPTISLTGSGIATAVPDMAMISLGVQRQAKTAREALSQNNQAMALVLAALKNLAIDEKDLQTSGFNIQPRFQYFNQSQSGIQRPPQIIGYTVTNQLTIRIRDLTKLGEIIDKTVTLGINTGGNIRFLSENPEEVLSLARKKAMADAISKATTLTKAAGVGLGRILTISENTRVPGPRPMREMAMARTASADAVPVAAGENSYQVSVQVSWEIVQ